MLVSMTNAAGVGTMSDVLQFGPRAPMNEVFPNMTLF